MLKYTFDNIEAEQYADESAAISSNLPTSSEAAYAKIYPSSDRDTISDGVDPQKITTAIVAEPDGTARHVPTDISVIDGVYYAQSRWLGGS